MRADAALVKRIIREQGLTMLYAWDIDERVKLAFKQGSTEDLCKEIDVLESTIASSYWVECLDKTVEGKPSRKSRQEQSFKWILPGLSGRASNTPAAVPSPVIAGAPPVDRDAIIAAAEANAEKRIADFQLESMRKELEELKALVKERFDDQDDDEEEEENDEIGEAPPATIWTPEVVKEMMGLGERMANGIIGAIRGRPVVTAPATPPVNGAPVNSAADLTDEELEVIRLARRWRGASPQQYRDTVEQLRTHFGDAPKEEPATNGQQEG